MPTNSWNKLPISPNRVREGASNEMGVINQNAVESFRETKRSTSPTPDFSNIKLSLF